MSSRHTSALPASRAICLGTTTASLRRSGARVEWILRIANVVDATFSAPAVIEFSHKCDASRNAMDAPLQGTNQEVVVVSPSALQ